MFLKSLSQGTPPRSRRRKKEAVGRMSPPQQRTSALYADALPITDHSMVTALSAIMGMCTSSNDQHNVPGAGSGQE